MSFLRLALFVPTSLWVMACGSSDPTPGSASQPVGAAITDTFFPTAGDGHVSRKESGGCGAAAWTLAHDATLGTNADSTARAPGWWTGVGCIDGFKLARGFLAFDTSAIPDNAVIESA